MMATDPTTMAAMASPPTERDTTDLPRLRPHEEEEEEEEEEEASAASVPDSRSDEASEKDT